MSEPENDEAPDEMIGWMKTLDIVLMRAACKRETPIVDADTIARCDKELAKREPKHRIGDQR